MQMAWVGTYLAAQGYTVVAVNHPGDNAVTGYTIPGFIEGWERAKDISTAITDLLVDPRFGSKIDPDRIGAPGFSYGGYTMMELAGATTDWNRILTSATSSRAPVILPRCRTCWKNSRPSSNRRRCNTPCNTPGIPTAIHASALFLP